MNGQTKYYGHSLNFFCPAHFAVALDKITLDIRQFYFSAPLAAKDGNYNLSEGGPTLTVEYDGMVKQTLAVPQYRPTGANVNYQELRYYFFGCFRPQFGFVDTRGAGFYADDEIVFAGLDILDAGLCKALLSWPAAGTGFNPYDQSGSGDETYDAGR